MVNSKKLKTIKTNQKPWKTMKVPWKIMKTKQKLWQTKTSKNIVNDYEVQKIASVAMVTCVQRKSVSPSFEKKDHRHCIATKIWWSFKSSRDQDVDDDNNTQSSFSLMSGESDIADGVRPFHHPHVWTSNCCDRSHSSLQGYYNLHPYHSFSSSRLLSPSSCQSWSRPAPGSDQDRYHHDHVNYCTTLAGPSIIIIMSKLTTGRARRTSTLATCSSPRSPRTPRRRRGMRWVIMITAMIMLNKCWCWWLSWLQWLRWAFPGICWCLHNNAVESTTTLISGLKHHQHHNMSCFLVS